MTEPRYERRAELSTVRDVLVVLVAIALTVWALVDDTLPDWLIRLGLVAAIVAAVALVLSALLRMWERP